MKKLFLLLIPTLFLTGCLFSDKFCPEAEECEICQECQEPKIDLFERKQECANYRDEIMKDILQPNLIYNDLDPVLNEIFYSPKRNSCLYVFRHYLSDLCFNDNLGTETKIMCMNKEVQIVDFLTKETIYESYNYRNCLEFRDSENCKTVSEKITELKEI